MDSLFYTCETCGESDVTMHDEIYYAGICSHCYFKYSNDPGERTANVEFLAYQKGLKRFYEYRDSL